MARSVEQAGVSTKMSSLSRQKRADSIAGYFFIAPALIFFGIFTVYPVLYGAYLSLFKINILNLDKRTFVGLDNFQTVLGSEDFQIGLWNTARFSFFVVILQTILALLLAVAVNQKIKGRTFFRTAFFFPSISSSVVISIIFLWVFNKFGLLNYFLSLFGINGPTWVDDPATALPSIMALNIWTTAGTMMVIYLAALQDIPGHLYEAASIDGATAFQRFMKITVPLLSSTTFFIVTLGLIGTFQMFDQAFVISNGSGGPERSTLTVVFYIYQQAFKELNGMGVAAAGAVVLFAIIFILTLLQRTLFKTEQQY
ncbi:MAG TPA: sugar ABC transporter permease [Chloroflexia bacterium]|nr:sugar ABC transporter permease [Chloroflexia bacterium]